MIFKFLINCLFLLSIIGANAQTLDNNKKKLNLEMNFNMIQPSYLQDGDIVAIIAPAGVLRQTNEVIQKTKTVLENWGLKVVFGENIKKKLYHFAGSDKERVNDFQWALDNPEIKAIWCARGGYGSLRIIDKLNFEDFKKNPKWIVGYSDITVVHEKLHKLGYQSIHGMMCINLVDDPKSIKLSLETLKSALFGELEGYDIEGNYYNKAGKAHGQLIGGNLTLIASTLGSKTSVNTKGKIIFIEEIGEYKYHIDRQLQSLKRAGYFDQCSGIIIGNISKLKINDPLWGQSVEELISDILKDTNFPIAFGFPAGHENENRALYLGRQIKLNITKNKTKIIF